MGGGLTGKITASRILPSAGMERATSACALCSVPLRSFQCQRLTKPSAAFWPEPAKLEADHADHVLNLRLLEHEVLDLLHHRQRALLRRTGGSCTLTRMLPLVLVRHEGGGRRRKTQVAAAITAT